MKTPLDKGPVRENARRLLEDARLLHENGRFASAVALAVISIEEAAKIYVGMSRKHGDKQRAAAVVGAIAAAESALEKIGIAWVRESESTDWQKQISSQESFQEFLVGFMTTAALGSDWGGILSDSTGSGSLSTLKNAALYVDGDEETWRSVDSDLSERLINLASTLTDTIETRSKLGVARERAIRKILDPS